MLIGQISVPKVKILATPQQTHLWYQFEAPLLPHSRMYKLRCPRAPGWRVTDQALSFHAVCVFTSAVFGKGVDCSALMLFCSRLMTSSHWRVSCSSLWGTNTHFHCVNRFQSRTLKLTYERRKEALNSQLEGEWNLPLYNTNLMSLAPQECGTTCPIIF